MNLEFFNFYNMKVFLTLLFTSLVFGLFSQNILLVEQPGTVKNYKYYAGNNISLKTKDGLVIKGPINIIKDTVIIVDFTNEVSINDIAIVYEQRTLVSLGSALLIGGSAMYLTLDLINGGNKGKSFSENQSWHISLAILAAGIGMRFFAKKKMKIEKGKWRIKILPQ